MPQKNCWKRRATVFAGGHRPPHRPAEDLPGAARAATLRPRATASSTCRCGTPRSTSWLRQSASTARCSASSSALPQVASQYLHAEKIELAKRPMPAQTGQSSGSTAACTSTSAARSRSRIRQAGTQRQRRQRPGVRLRRRLPRAHHRALRPSPPATATGAATATSTAPSSSNFPTIRRPRGPVEGGVRRAVRGQVRRLFESRVQRRVGSQSGGQCEYAAFYVEPIQGTGGYVIPPPNFFTA